MSEERMCDERGFEEEIRRYIGETVTIFTTSGGESGSGFTGVVLSVSRNFVKLITQPGSGPGSPFRNHCDRNEHCGGHEHCNERGDRDRGFSERGFNERDRDRECHERRCNDDNRGFRLGSVTDIPMCRITAFVHNAV